jgi:flagellar biogenesis protein FliO
MILAIGKNAKINQKRQIIISVSQISFIIAMITAVIFLVDQVGRFVG